jgi:hypothetical protein
MGKEGTPGFFGRNECFHPYIFDFQGLNMLVSSEETRLFCLTDSFLRVWAGHRSA